MAKYGKWIGGGLGWAFGGPIGAILGFALGSAVDNLKIEKTNGQVDSRTRPGDFGFSLVILSAAVIKADGKILKSELDFVRKFLKSQFGEIEGQEKMLLLRDVIKQDFSVSEVCLQIKYNLDYHSRLQLMHYLFGIAVADGNVDKSEYDLIKNIATYMGISTKDFASIKAMFYKDADSAYKILEISSDATDSEIKSAYRNMAIKFHPDKLSHLGDEFQNAAKEKFQKVNDAYQTLKKERGFK